jgi:response regulator of citrate/malate metabolism
MSEQQGINAAKRAGQVARAMLDGSMHYLIGALELEQLRHEIGAYENDPDFIAFVAVKMEVESIPDNENLLESLNDKNSPAHKVFAESVAWAKSISLAQCVILAERYPKG